uniref:Uncharacterized protein n=1 Tax=Ananas comosus var. bracteatus TaxID=296719 RepID=A0A6V7NPH2_ANACO|nr:unnamed protein product [Ananas comosus var. bracteatus]
MVSFSKPQAMAVASKAVNYWKSLANTRGYATSTMPKTRSVASAVDEDLLATRRTSKPRGDYVPVYVALGLIVLSTSFGLYTAKQQLVYAPNVLVDKKKRETIPEVVDPDWAISEASASSTSRFSAKSHTSRTSMPSEPAFPTPPAAPPPVICKPVKAETLKDVGVERRASRGARPCSRESSVEGRPISEISFATIILPVKAETLKDVGVEPPGIERRPSLFERIFRRRTADQ